MSERLFKLFCRACAVIPVAVIVLLPIFLFQQSRGSLSLSLFFGEASPLDVLFRGARVWDGIWPACVGTVSVVGLSCLTAVPVGILCGIHLSEFASGRMKRVLALCVDILAGVPSILMGLFGFALILFLRRTVAPEANTGLLLSGLCMGLLVLPYMINSVVSSMEALPADLRLMGPSLGLSKMQSILHVLLPASGKGIMSGVVLSIGRAAEDTAVIMLTGVVADAGLPRGLFDKYEALPFFIYTTAAEFRSAEELGRGFGAALVLLLLAAAMFLGANLLQRTMERRWRRGV